MEILVPIPPLTTWQCDKCTRWIEGPADGVLEWVRTRIDGPRVSYHIVHSGAHSPYRRLGPNVCSYFAQHPWHEAVPLAEVAGPENLPNLLSVLDGAALNTRLLHTQDVADLGDCLKIFLRLQTPYFEEGQFHLQQALEQGELGELLPTRLFRCRYFDTSNISHPAAGAHHQSA